MSIDRPHHPAAAVERARRNAERARDVREQGFEVPGGGDPLPAPGEQYMVLQLVKLGETGDDPPVDILAADWDWVRAH